VVDAGAPIVLDSAARHGVAEEDALHAWASAVDVFTVDAGMVMYIGPDRAGNLLEIGVVEWHDSRSALLSRLSAPHQRAGL
jgi:hypothetical protein